jgi:hypothetical protein
MIILILLVFKFVESTEAKKQQTQEVPSRGGEGRCSDDKKADEWVSSYLQKEKVRTKTLMQA